jgi:hydroxyquinol 1,2-dioxygenase
MRNFDEATITDAVLQRVRAAKDDRIRQVSEALVRHLHAFVREIEPTQAEWETGIDFLTRTGQTCDDKRQEFILLSDTLGVSMLVDAINHRTPEGATETTVLWAVLRAACTRASAGCGYLGRHGRRAAIGHRHGIDGWRRTACRRRGGRLALGR